MDTLWEALGASFQPVLISVATLAIVALLRLITPSVRWSRRLQHDAGIFNALPEGSEKDLWELIVTAQAERLRIYREDRTLGEQFLGWYSFVALLLLLVMYIAEAASGFPVVASLAEGGPFGVVVGGLGFLSAVVIPVYVSIRLVRGIALVPGPGRGGNYPKMVALAEAEKGRRAKRIIAEGRRNAAEFYEQRDRKAGEKAERRARESK